MREVKGCWTDLFHTFMVALDIRKMSIGFVGLALTGIVVLVPLFSLGAVHYRRGVIEHAVNQGEELPPVSQGMSFSPDEVLAILDVGWRTAFPGLRLDGLKTVCTESKWGQKLRGGMDFVDSLLATGPIEQTQLFGVIPCTVSQRTIRWGSLLFFGLLLTLIWAKFGGAITRIAAVEIAKDERIETQKALEYSSKKFGHYFWAPVACVLFFLLFYGCVWGVAWLGRIPWLNIVVMLGFPLALLSGFIMTLIVIGTFFGFPLFYPAISTEGTDSFDAISRGFSYFFSKPCHYVAYQIVAFLFGILSFAIVQYFGYLMLKATFAAGRIPFGQINGLDFDHVFLGIWSGTPYSLARLHEQSTSLWLSAVVFNTWVSIFKGMILAYSISFFFSAQSMIYLLLRKQVDSIEMTEVYEEPEEEMPPAAPPAPAPAAPSAPAPAGGPAAV
ncbi:MAG: hypothetical protein HYY93_08740 [Planctomycetes bacterium]|nr:hypothetical protein [Planctomycetota bacterium]